MIKIENIENGEIMQVWQTGIDKTTGRIYCNGTPTAKYLAKYPLTATDEKIGEDTVLILNDGWEVVRGKGERKQRQQKPDVVIKQENDEKERGTGCTDSSRCTDHSHARHR